MKSLTGKLDRVKNLIRYFRFKPFDTSTEAGRSAERHRRIALTSATSIGARFLSMAVPLITIPLTLNYLGKELYGIWMTLSALTASIGYADLGIGLGFFNKVTEAIGKDDRRQARIYISSAFVMLSTVATLFGVAYLIGSHYINWATFFKASSPEATTVVPVVMLIFVICFLLNMPLSIVERLYLAHQEGFVSQIAQLITNFVYLLAVVVIVKANLGLPCLVLASSGLPLARLVVNGARLFFLQRPWLMPSLRCFNFRAAREMMHVGFLFFILQLGVVIGYNSDNIVIARIRGAAAVADYSVAAKLFAIVMGLISATIVPFWPALMEAASIGDVAWVKKTFRRAIRTILAVTIPGSIFLFFASKIFIRVWTHNQLHTTSLVLIALAVWTVVGGLGNFIDAFLNAMNALKYKVVVFTAASVVNLALSIWLTKQLGAPGVVMGSTIAQLLLFIPTFGWEIPRIFKRLAKEKDGHQVTTSTQESIIPDEAG